MDMIWLVGPDFAKTMFDLDDAHSTLTVGLFRTSFWTGALVQMMPIPKFDLYEKIESSREDYKQGYTMEHGYVQGR